MSIPSSNFLGATPEWKAPNCENAIWFKNYCHPDAQYNLQNFEFTLDEITSYEQVVLHSYGDDKYVSESVAKLYNGGV